MAIKEGIQMKAATSVVTYKTAMLADMEHGIKLYNQGLYGCVKNPDLDDRARGCLRKVLGLRLRRFLSR